MEHYTFIARLFDFSQSKVQDVSVLSVIIAYWLSILTMFTNSVLGISALLFGLLIIVMLTDYITGLAASKKEGVKFCSKKGLGWVFKLGSYMIFLAISFALQKEITCASGFEFMKWPMQLIHFYILIHIFIWETKSVDENFERLGYNFRILKLFSSILLIAKSKVKDKISEDGKR